MIRYGVYLLVIFALSRNPVAADMFQPPVTYHLSFETFDFLKDDIQTKYPEPSLEERNLHLVPGQFGKALHNAEVFRLKDQQQVSMTAWDLDTLMEVIVHHRFGIWQKKYSVGNNHPYIWGTGRLKTDGGSVAFWAKAKPGFRRYLFFQASSSFGRFEKYLIAIELKEDLSLEAYVRDARYDYHKIETKPLWDTRRFNHVALVWDRMYGLTLYLNGERVASNWGNDAWFTTQIPGLFHMPLTEAMFDELWIFDRPLKEREVKRLMDENIPPDSPENPFTPDEKAVERIGNTFIGDGTDHLAPVKAFQGEQVTVFEELYPEWAGDGIMTAPYVLDGKYELAWPQDYSSFTNILGDSDFHAEKVDFRLPENKTVNYVSLEGNLTDARMLAIRDDSVMEPVEILSVPEEKQFFHASLIKPISNTLLRIPFVKGFGSPPGYEPGLHLALTGDIRIHEAAFFNVREEPIPHQPVAGIQYVIDSQGTVPSDSRYGYAMKTLNDARNNRILSLTRSAKSRTEWITPGPFTRINLLSETSMEKRSITAFECNLNLRNVSENDVMVLQLHDPGIPSRIWNRIVFRLNGFDRGSGILRVTCDFTDIKLAPKDRIWMDILFSGNEQIKSGKNSGSYIRIATSPLNDNDGRYAEKALQPCLGDFSKANFWYYPWMALGDIPDPEKPVTFGGFYDIINFPLAILRTEPDNYISRTILDLGMVESDYRGTYGKTGETWGKRGIAYRDSLRNAGGTTEGVELVSREMSPIMWPPVKIKPNDGSPEWAFYMHYYLSRYKNIVDWFAENQNYDGQVGGGWNDDVLFASRLPNVFLYIGYENARRIFNRIFEGLERTRMFHDGYCNIDPMDFIHVNDLTRNRYEGLVFEPGDPYKMKIAMRTAWRLGKPDQTPVNYIDGGSFKPDHDVLLWYWGETPAYPPYRTTRNDVTATVKKYAPAMDDVIRFRYTESRKFTDTSNMPGCHEFKAIQIGGKADPFLDNLTLAVTWEEGGESDIPKWVETATDTDFIAHMYSYGMVERNVTARLYRIKKGMYHITLAYEGDDSQKGTIVERTEELTRFSKVTVPVRPGREIVLKIDHIEALPDPGPLPDLAIDDIDCTEGIIRANVYNFGAAPAAGITVGIFDSLGRLIEEKNIDTLDSARDFVPKQAEIIFDLKNTDKKPYRISVDPNDSIEEIIEENNDVIMKNNL